MKPLSLECNVVIKGVGNFSSKVFTVHQTLKKREELRLPLLGASVQRTVPVFLCVIPEPHF